MKTLTEEREKARRQDHDELLSPTKQMDTKIPRIPYYPGITNKSMVAYRRTKNLPDQLVRANLSSKPTDKPTTSPNKHPSKTLCNCKFYPKKDRSKT